MRAYQFIPEYQDDYKDDLAHKAGLPVYKDYEASKVHNDHALKFRGKEDASVAMMRTAYDSNDLNNYLHKLHRGKIKPNPYFDHLAHRTDKIINRRAKFDFTVYSGIAVSPTIMWNRHGVPTDQPIRFHLPAYTHTSTNYPIAKEFAYAAKMYMPEMFTTTTGAPIVGKKTSQVLKFLVPKGMLCASFAEWSTNEGEDEIQLPRGIEIEVSPHPTQLKDRTVVWHCKIVGRNPIPITNPHPKDNPNWDYKEFV